MPVTPDATDAPRTGTSAGASAPRSRPVAAGLPAPADIARTWPAPVPRSLALRAAELLAQHPLPAGRILDLNTPADRDLVVATAAELSRPDHLRGPTPLALGSVAGATSWGGLAAFADVVGALRAVAALLDPTGCLLFAEPTGRPGLVGLVRASLEARRSDLREVHLARDLTGAMREAGLIVAQVHRELVPGVPVVLRHLAYGRAVPAAPPTG